MTIQRSFSLLLMYKMGKRYINISLKCWENLDKSGQHAIELLSFFLLRILHHTAKGRGLKGAGHQHFSLPAVSKTLFLGRAYNNIWEGQRLLRLSSTLLCCLQEVLAFFSSRRSITSLRVAGVKRGRSSALQLTCHLETSPFRGGPIKISEVAGGCIAG